MSKRKVRVKVAGYVIVSAALDSAIQYAMNKSDKWNKAQLTDAQRQTLAEQVANYFWVALEEAGAEIE